MNNIGSRDIESVKVITSMQRRKRRIRWSVAEKFEIAEDTEPPGMTVSYVASKKPGISPSRPFQWRKPERDGKPSVIRAVKQVTPVSAAKRLKAGIH